MKKFNSHIRVKNCRCSETCKKFPTIGWDGYNFSHAPQELKDKQTKKQVEKRNRAKLSDLSRKVHLAANDKGIQIKGNLEAVMIPQGQLVGWFIDRMANCEPKCENCKVRGAYLKYAANKFLWKSCQAHLLPKKHFKSLQAHPLNGMVLGSGLSGLCNCHDTYDSSWEKAAKMPIWEEVVRRFKIMYPLITQEEHRFIPPQLLQEVNQV